MGILPVKAFIVYIENLTATPMNRPKFVTGVMASSAPASYIRSLMNLWFWWYTVEYNAVRQRADEHSIRAVHCKPQRAAMNN